ncbi:transcriptional regulator [Pyrenochaeta sp. MPI-SDFR-AT-0127]|nr:transcriptional regulator [Pyrenochaeta sp. MPI-SDFR-AT-0127]
MGGFKGSDPGRADLRTVGNYSFRWTKDHVPKEMTDPLRFEHDELGAATVNKIQEIHQREQEARKQQGEQPAKLDMYATLKANQEHDETLSKFWTQVNTVPDWVDWVQLERGQRFFYRYALGNIIGFALQGFVGENSASKSVVEVLLRTGGFSTRSLRRRLLETFQLVLEVTHSLAFIKPGGKGHETTVRVRLLHSMVQQRMLRVAEAKGSSYFDTTVHGVPLNTLDSVHAITTFSCNHAWQQLPHMGVRPAQGEIDDYIALWRYIAHVIGTPPDFFATTLRAKAIMESLSYNERLVTPSSLVVGHNFVEALKDLPPINISGGFIQAGSRWLNGDEICDQLGIGKPGWYPYACFKGHCWLVVALATAQRWLPSFEAWSIDLYRDTLHSAIIHSKYGLQGGSLLDFKYIPDGRITGREKNDRPGGDRMWFYQRPLELLYFVVFCIGCFSILGITVIAAKLVLALVFNGMFRT